LRWEGPEAMREAFRTRLGTFYVGDSREVAGLSKGSTYAIVTDPPYSSGGFQEAGRAPGSIGTTTGVTIEGDNLSTRGYLRLIGAALRPLRGANDLFWFCDWRQWSNVSDHIEDNGWRVRAMLVWAKPSPGLGMPWRNQHELICYGRRGPLSRNGNTRAIGNVLLADRTGNRHHPTEKPVDLLRQLIRNTSAETIVDPFAGSGSTAIAAELEGRRWVCVDLLECFAEVAEERLRAQVSQFRLFEPEPEAKQEALDF